VYLNALKFELRHKNPYNALFEELCIQLTQVDRESDVFKVLYEAIENT